MIMAFWSPIGSKVGLMTSFKPKTNAENESEMTTE